MVQVDAIRVWVRVRDEDLGAVMYFPPGPTAVNVTDAAALLLGIPPESVLGLMYGEKAVPNDHVLKGDAELRLKLATETR